MHASRTILDTSVNSYYLVFHVIAASSKSTLWFGEKKMYPQSSWHFRELSRSWGERSWGERRIYKRTPVWHYRVLIWMVERNNASSGAVYRSGILNVRYSRSPN